MDSKLATLSVMSIIPHHQRSIRAIAATIDRRTTKRKLSFEEQFLVSRIRSFVSMNNSSRWLWVVLISTVQLVLLLAAVVALFVWLKDSAERTLGQQTCRTNFTTIKNLSDSIEALELRDIRRTDSPDSEQLRSLLSQFNVSNGGRIDLFDFGSGHCLLGIESKHENRFQNLSDIQLQPLDLKSKTRPLREAVSNKTKLRSAFGKVELDQQIYYASAKFLPSLNAVIVVTQQQSLASLELMHSISRFRYYAFAGTLLLGLIGVCLTTSFVTRVSDTVVSMNDGMEKIVCKGARELMKSKNAVIFGLAKLAESRDNDTGEHLERIRAYVTILVTDLADFHEEFDQEFIHNIGLASSLHDIGKVGIPDSILLKPGRLTSQERQIMEMHTLIGGECLDAIHARLGENDFMHIARQIAYYHHERWDGTGYPHSLKETEIPLVARITAVADVYDALTSKRPYKIAMSHQEAKDIIAAGKAKHFDPQVVEAFLRHEDEFQRIAREQQDVSDEDATSSFQRLAQSVCQPDDFPENDLDKSFSSIQSLITKIDVPVVAHTVSS